MAFRYDKVKEKQCIPKIYIYVGKALAYFALVSGVYKLMNSSNVLKGASLYTEPLESRS